MADDEKEEEGTPATRPLARAHEIERKKKYFAEQFGENRFKGTKKKPPVKAQLKGLKKKEPQTAWGRAMLADFDKAAPWAEDLEPE